MIVRTLPCLLGLWLPLAAHAEAIYRCETPDGIQYQGTPCTGREAEIVARSVVGAPIESTTPKCGARLGAASRLWRRTTLCIGITDDEVLNLPGWGRPAKILRTRAQRLWREQWTYDADTYGSRQLHFVNGKLASIETGAAATNVGSIASLAGQE